jgi:trigger factor
MSTVEIKEIGPCKKQISVSCSVEEVAEAWNSNLKEVGANIVLPGFRKGKIPKNIIEKRFAKDLEAQVKQTLVTEHYEKALKENDLTPLSDPHIESVDLDREKGLQFLALVEIHPDVSLTDYKGISVDREIVEVSEKDVQEAIDQLRRQRATLETTEKKAAQDDYLTVSGKFFLEEDGMEILSREHALVRAGHDFFQDLVISGLGKKIMGQKAGSTLSMDFEIDSHFPLKEHRGKKARLEMTVEEVKVEKLPEIDSEFLKMLSFDSENDLREKVREDLEISKKSLADEKCAEALLAKIAENLDFPVPEDLLRRQCLNLIRQTEAVYRLSAAAKEDQEKILEEEIEKVKEAAIIQVRNFFILEEVAKKEKIFVTEREMAQHMAELAASRRQDLQELIREVKDSGALSEIRLGIRERKTAKWLLEKADVTEKTKEEIFPEKKSSKKNKPSALKKAKEGAQKKEK